MRITFDEVDAASETSFTLTLINEGDAALLISYFRSCQFLKVESFNSQLSQNTFIDKPLWLYSSNSDWRCSKLYKLARP